MTAFGYEELASEAFDAELARVIAERRQQETRKRVQEREAQAVVQAVRETAWVEPVMGNDDRSTGARILASLAYVLPLIDSIQYGLPLVQALPIFSPLLALLAIPSVIVNSVPFGIGNIILFGVWLFLSRRPEYPWLVRYNLLQAVYLNVAFWLPTTALTLMDGGQPTEIGGFVYFCLLAVCGYCAFMNSQGKYPDGLPGVSSLAQQKVDQMQTSDRW